MKNEHLVMLTNDFFDKNHPPFLVFEYGKQISPKKIRKASKSYAYYDAVLEKPLLLIDETMFNLAPKGILITTGQVFYRLYMRIGERKVEAGRFNLADIKDMEIRRHESGITAEFFINGKCQGILLGFGRNFRSIHEAEVLNSYFKLIIDSVKL